MPRDPHGNNLRLGVSIGINNLNKALCFSKIPSQYVSVCSFRPSLTANVCQDYEQFISSVFSPHITALCAIMTLWLFQLYPSCFITLLRLLLACAGGHPSHKRLESLSRYGEKFSFRAKAACQHLHFSLDMKSAIYLHCVGSGGCEHALSWRLFSP